MRSISLLLLPTMSFTFLHNKLPSIGRAMLTGRCYHRAISTNDRISVSVFSKERGNGVKLSWPAVSEALSYQVKCVPSTSEDYNVIVSSQNFTELRHLKKGVKYFCSISPFNARNGLLEASYSTEISFEDDSSASSEKKSRISVMSDISPLEIRVGKIVEICKHPEADKLYIEKIDCGEEEGARTIVSGLVPFCSEDDLLHRNVLVLCNLKPRPLQGIVSHGMVLCASDASHEHVDPISPPPNAKIGDLIYFEGHISDPKPPGNAAVKAFKKVVERLHSDMNGVATFDGEPFMTNNGPCTTSIVNGKIS